MYCLGDTRVVTCIGVSADYIRFSEQMMTQFNAAINSLLRAKWYL